MDTKCDICRKEEVPIATEYSTCPACVEELKDKFRWRKWPEEKPERCGDGDGVLYPVKEDGSFEVKLMLWYECGKDGECCWEYDMDIEYWLPIKFE